MTDRSTRRAFLLGCNSAGLEHCESDAIKMRKALERHGWAIDHCVTTTELTASCADSRDYVADADQHTDIVTKRVRRFLDDCRHGDSVIVYFSGHSCYQHDVFQLVVGDSINDNGHLLNITVLFGLFQQYNYLGDRLLILDCCDAADAVTRDFWVNTQGGWARIWVATRGMEDAQELDGETQGGLFTALILHALNDEAGRLANSEDGCLRLNQADEFVQRQAKSLEFPGGKPAPIPRVFGDSGQNILLADNLHPLLETGFSGDALQQLSGLIQASGIDQSKLTILYHDVRVRAGLTAAGGYSDPRIGEDPGTPAVAVERLARAYSRDFCIVKVALAEFVERVALLAGDHNAKALRDWLRSALAQVIPDRDVDEVIASLNLGQTASSQTGTPLKSHLSILLCPRDRNRPSQYSFEARLVDRAGEGGSVHAPAGLVADGDMPQTLKLVLNQPAVLEAIQACDPLCIEFFLPSDLLAEDVDAWTPGFPEQNESSRVTPLTARYVVTVRSQARLGSAACPESINDNDPERYGSGWYARWNSDYFAASRDSEQDGKKVPAYCVRIPSAPAPYQSLVKRGGCVFYLGFSPEGGHLDEMLQAGLDVVLWGREPLTEDFGNQLMQAVARTYPTSPKRPRLADLPLAVLDLRQDIWEQTRRHTGHFHLLWDNPNRIPAFSGRRGAAAGTTKQPMRLHEPY